MRWLATYLVCIFYFSALAQPPEIKRICPLFDDNTVTWQNPVYNCPTFHFYIIWGSDRIGGPYFPIDTVLNSTATTYTHTNASPIRFYFLERRDSCAAPNNHYSDTLGIDDVPASKTILDSVSVDIATNTIYLGWGGNPTPDFDRYFIYVVNPTYTTLNPGGTRDTFFIDNTGNNPQTGPLKYDINTIDSCGNPSVFENPHTTVHLKNTVDTCLKRVHLTWTSYIGWNGVLKYYILEDAGSGYNLIDSVAGNITDYSHPILLGQAYNYFVRALKDTTIRITSSSNRSSLTTRKRNDPEFIRINYVTSNHSSSNILINFSTSPNPEITRYRMLISNLGGTLLSTTNLNNADLGQDINSGLSDNSRYLVKVIADDVCDLPITQSDSSTNIVLSHATSIHRSLVWNSYFTWNTGVQSYRIFRGTGDPGSFNLTLWQEVFDTAIIDSSTFTDARSLGVCYYIEAIKAGAPDTTSKSNILCFPEAFTLFFPTAFVPSGVNNTFRPGGNSIDYEHSTIQIYDRWGKIVYDGKVGNGWNGNDFNGSPCMDGVYYYKANMFSVLQENQIKNGTFTLLR